VTFGSFNNLAKINQPLLKRWSEILRALPGSRLRLKARGLACTAAANLVRQVMSQCGIEPDRVEMSSQVPWSEHLSGYNQIDVALDTYPYHGTATTCEALWMGVPVVTQAGVSHVSRVGVSLMTNVGLAELIGGTGEDYIRLATALAGDLPRLSGLRSTLRGRMQNSALMDAGGMACDIEAAYRTMWRSWCAASKGG
jgi:predicted O-linked N-acetylglucosamine transferase (SPINDLY family)